MKFTQGELATAVGREQAAISRYESGDEIPSDVLGKLRELGYDGPDGSGKTTVAQSGIAPEHIRDAWVIVSESYRDIGADMWLMDQNKLGTLISWVAEEIATKGKSSEVLEKLKERVAAVRPAQLEIPK